MQNETHLTYSRDSIQILLRELALAGFRHRRLAVVSFATIFTVSVLYVLIRTPQYRSQMTILVNLQRADPVVSSEANVQPRYIAPISDEEVNSELSLLESRDLLEQVVIRCGLHIPKKPTGLASALGWMHRSQKDEQTIIAEAILVLQKKLTVEVVPKTTLIRISYISANPELAARVLDVLSDLYLKKHLAVRRPSGAFDFFKQESDLHRQNLADAEKRLADFGREQNIASVQAEQDATLKKLTELEVDLKDTNAAIESAKQHIGMLQIQIAGIPARLTTQVRESSGKPPDQLQSALLTLELKRTELLAIFKPDYPSVKEVEKEIADTKAAIASSQKESTIEETTDRDPTHEFLRADLEKSKLALVDLQSRAQTSSQLIRQYQVKARELDQMALVQQDLVRNAKVTEEKYLTYEKQAEEARISDALDSRHIVNVAIAERPYVPRLSAMLPGSVVLLLGILLGGTLSTGLTLAADRLDRSFRTPREVQLFLNVPVVAAIPEDV